MPTFVYKIDRHVVSFFCRRRRWTRRAVFTYDYTLARKAETSDGLRLMAGCSPGADLGQFGKFRVIADHEGKEPAYFTGEWAGRDMPVFSKDIHEAQFYLDEEAALETAAGMRVGGRKLAVQNAYLDYANELPRQQFLMTCENRRNGFLSYLKWYNGETKELRTCRYSDAAQRMGFRECLAMLDGVRNGCKLFKYSMIHCPDRNVYCRDLPEYIKASGRTDKIALSFNLPQEGKR